VQRKEVMSIKLKKVKKQWLNNNCKRDWRSPKHCNLLRRK
jgi:hypothetical protein